MRAKEIESENENDKEIGLDRIGLTGICRLSIHTGESEKERRNVGMREEKRKRTIIELARIERPWLVWLNRINKGRKATMALVAMALD